MNKPSYNSDRRLFGTDGIRGTVNAGKVTAIMASIAMRASARPHDGIRATAC